MDIIHHHVDTTIESPALISICTGSRGLERGIESAIGRQPTVAAYVEIEAFICQNLVAEMEAGVLAPAPIYTDLTTFDGLPFRGRIHGIVGGYPCQGESNAGKRQLWDDPRFLYPHIERLIIAAQPLFCFFENVSGHLQGSFIYVLASLRDLGYRVEVGLYAAEEVGGIQRERFVIGTDHILECDLYRRLPHQRLRIFILAVKLEHAQRNGHLAATLRPRRAASDRQEPQGPQTSSNLARAGRPNGNGSVHEELEHTKSGRTGGIRDQTGTGQGHGLAGRSGILREDSDIGEPISIGKYAAKIGEELFKCTGQTGEDAELGNAPCGQDHGRERGSLDGAQAQGRCGNTTAHASGEDAELANSNSIRQPYCQPCQQPTERGQHAQRNPAASGDEELANSEGIRVQGLRTQRQQEPQPHVGEGISMCSSRGFAVARPGWPQHEWEEPRAVESGMGCTIDGYNFREDLLRMYGNGVVPQCAELAYTELYYKLFGADE